MAAISISLRGDKELIRMLDRLPVKIARKVVPAAASKSMTPVSKMAKKLVRGQTRGTGLLSRSIGKKRKIYRASGNTIVVVGVRMEFKRKAGGSSQGGFRNPSKYAHLVEFGHSTPGGGFVAPKPFLRPALQRNLGKIKSTMSREIMIGIGKEAKKGRKK